MEGHNQLEISSVYSNCSGVVSISQFVWGNGKPSPPLKDIIIRTICPKAKESDCHIGKPIICIKLCGEPPTSMK